MAVKYSVGLSATSRDRSLLKRRRASSNRANAKRGRASDDRRTEPTPRGWLLLTQEWPSDEPREPSATWAW